MSFFHTLYSANSVYNSIRSMNDHITSTLAGIGTMAPFWIPYLAEVNSIIALAVGLASCGWFCVQIYYKIRNKGQ